MAPGYTHDVQILGDLMQFASMGLALVLAIATLVVGAVVVRPVQPTAGFALVAAGAVRLLSVCCVDGSLVLRDQGFLDGAQDAVSWLVTLASPLDHVVFWGLVGFAAYSVASARAPGAA